MFEPIFTVGIATLNRPQYLEEAIRSVVSAAYKSKCRIQLVVSDMGGNIESFEAFERSTHQSPSWLECEWYCDTKIQSGIQNWDNCLEKARGRYYMMIGDDDRLLPDAFIQLMTVLGDFRCDVTGLLASARDIDANGQHRRTMLNKNRVYEGRKFLADVVTRRLALRWCAFIAKTSVLKSCSPFKHPFPRGGGSADGAAIVSAALAGNIVTLDVAISEFRVHDGNDSRSISLTFQRDQRETLLLFLDSVPQVTAADRALILVWLGAGIRFQCLRWAIQGKLDKPMLNDLEKLAREYLNKYPEQTLPLKIRLFEIASNIVGAIARLLTNVSFKRKTIV